LFDTTPRPVKLSGLDLSGETTSPVKRIWAPGRLWVSSAACATGSTAFEALQPEMLIAHVVAVAMPSAVAASLVAIFTVLE
jgi:hypothetical protein